MIANILAAASSIAFLALLLALRRPLDWETRKWLLLGWSVSAGLLVAAFAAITYEASLDPVLVVVSPLFAMALIARAVRSAEDELRQAMRSNQRLAQSHQRLLRQLGGRP